MLGRIWIVSSLCAVAMSAPTLSLSAAEVPAEMKVLSEYFQLLGQKVQEGRKMGAAPACDMSNANLPVASPTPLPSPADGLKLMHVAVGRGTQNYTCSQTNATAVPVAVGAVATLYNASCIASTYPDLLSQLPPVALAFNLTSPIQKALSAANLAISGQHFFSNNTTPTFNIDLGTENLGFGEFHKNNSVPAPKTAMAGQAGAGNGAVPWLKLLSNAEEGGMREVYRVNTAGGMQPAICAGMPASFVVEYAAEYWFYD